MKKLLLLLIFVLLINQVYAVETSSITILKETSIINSVENPSFSMLIKIYNENNELYDPSQDVKVEILRDYEVMETFKLGDVQLSRESLGVYLFENDFSFYDNGRYELRVTADNGIKVDNSATVTVTSMNSYVYLLMDKSTGELNIVLLIVVSVVFLIIIIFLILLAVTLARK